MQEKQHLSRYKGVRASCHNEQLFWHHSAIFEKSKGVIVGGTIKIYRQSTRIIFGAHVAPSLLWNTLTILHTSCASLSFA